MSLKIARVMKDYTLAELYEITGINPNKLSKAERSIKPIDEMFSYKELKTLANALDVTIEELVNEE